MKKQVKLEGFLGDEFGPNWNIKARTLPDIFACIQANFPDFKSRLIEAVDNGTNFIVFNGQESMGEENLGDILTDEVIIMPAPTGAKSGGAKILIGVALLAAVFFLPVIPVVGGGLLTLGAAASGVAAGTASGVTAAASLGVLTAFNAGMGIGISLITSGIQQLLAPDPSVDDDDENYLFDGPAQTTISRRPVPYLYGRKIVPGITISSAVLVGQTPKSSGIYTDRNGNLIYGKYFGQSSSNVLNARYA